jgi:hypothetical protein
VNRRHSFQRRNAEAWRRASYWAHRGLGRESMRDLLLVMARAQREGHLSNPGLAQIHHYTVAPLQMIPVAYWVRDVSTAGRCLRSDAQHGLKMGAELLLRRRAGMCLGARCRRRAAGASDWCPGCARSDSRMRNSQLKKMERLWAAAAPYLPTADSQRLDDFERRSRAPEAPGAASARARRRRASSREMSQLLRTAYR